MRLLLAALAVGIASCTAPGGPPIADLATQVNATLDTGGFVVGPGDSLNVTIQDNPDWDQLVIVQPDGLASFRGLEPMATAGLKPGQIQRELEQKYIPVVGEVHVSVALSELSPRYISVLGELTSPGQVPIELGHRMTLLDAFAGASGYRKDTARLGNVILVRWDAEAQRQISWTVDARPQTWTGGSSILLQPYDLVYVPNTPIDNVNIWVDKYIRQNIPFPQLVTVQ